jgi:hypothetical protein
MASFFIFLIIIILLRRRRLRLLRSLISSAIRRIRYFFCLSLNFLLCRSLFLARKLIGLLFFVAL